jgi:hypothetical protein
MKPVVTLPFIILSLIAGVALIILGLLISGFGGFFESLVDDVCALKAD